MSRCDAGARVLPWLANELERVPMALPGIVYDATHRTVTDSRCRVQRQGEDGRAACPLDVAILKIYRRDKLLGGRVGPTRRSSADVRARQLLAQSIRVMMIAHLQYFDAEPPGQSEQVVPGAFLEES